MVGGIPSTESVTEIVNFESGRTYCEEIDNKAWGYIEYATPLAPQQASDYELVLAPQKPSIPKPPLNFCPECGRQLKKTKKEDET